MFIDLLRRYDPVQCRMYQYHRGVGCGPRDPLQVYLPRYDRQLILNNLRLDIKGELEAVILYEQALDAVPCEDVRRVFHQVIADEKGHAEHLTALLGKYGSP